MTTPEERIELAIAILDGVYDGPETPNGSAIAEAMAILEGDPNAIAAQNRRTTMTDDTAARHREAMALLERALELLDEAYKHHCKSDNPWRTHDGDQMPECYAPAQMVEWVAEYQGVGRAELTNSAKNIAWKPGVRHRPVLRDGLPVVSAEGLSPSPRYVATDANGSVWQYPKRPYIKFGEWTVGHLLTVYNVPSTHRIPGDWRESLAIVEGR